MGCDDYIKNFELYINQFKIKVIIITSVKRNQHRSTKDNLF